MIKRENIIVIGDYVQILIGEHKDKCAEIISIDKEIVELNIGDNQIIKLNKNSIKIFIEKSELTSEELRVLAITNGTYQ